MMKLPTLLAIVLFIISCQESKTRQQIDNVYTVDSAKRVVENQTPRPLYFYKCDYAADQYITILSSGNDHQQDEIWGINRRDIAKLPMLDINSLDTSILAEHAAIHLKSRFPGIDLLSTNFTLERIDDQDTSNERNWYIDVTFLYDKRGYVQKVPVLLDGRIVLSNNE
jgi:hypothetical protein